MENLNAEQVKKALGYCKSPKLTKCDGCPREQEDGHCMYKLNEDALALINSQEQRIKELTEENERLSQSLANSKSILANSKADTVRQMQERLKAQKFTHKNFGELVYVEDIDQIAKEMLEGINES